MAEKKDPTKPPRDTGGPVVKTGPTRGDNRSRNEDGQWRKKRSDAGKEKKKSGCYITTAVCKINGLPDDCLELETLRSFRDDVLMHTREGRALVARYYEIAPGIAAGLHDSDQVASVWRTVQECVTAISEARHQDAIQMYQAMTARLTCHKSAGEA
ncbi:CFI-box-CTERM domain-containing protein [Roseateles sp. LKC17W]|uniref:CFI-box-CTERM domain-containing protein n=1 Tax=Pelomonas margarita TaxID=3299031 RepID=A0ABW7FPS6_9BURK